MNASQKDLGRRIIHRNPVFDEPRAGVIAQILSSQFTYKTDTGAVFMCLFSEDWEYAKDDKAPVTVAT